MRMASQIGGSWSVAQTVARCRPAVISAFPIPSEAPILETLGALVESGTLTPCELVAAASEFDALSVAIGASAAGARVYTASAARDLLPMVQPLCNASDLGLPIVMTVAALTPGAPGGVSNDHSDVMRQRDSGWLQLYPESNQEAVDVHLQAFRVAEELSLPVMVCTDGVVLDHVDERVELPPQEQVDAFLPAYEPRQVLDPAEPVSMGAMIGPETSPEVRYVAHTRQLRALDLLPAVAADFAAAFGRESGGLVSAYRTQDADTIVVALGSMLGTIKDAIDVLREQGLRIGVAGVKTFRPFPLWALRTALRGAARVVVIEKALAVGLGGIVSDHLRTALARLPIQVSTVIAGLGGRTITRASLLPLLTEAAGGRLETLTFLDLDRLLVERELARSLLTYRSGPAGAQVV
jgi:pyruvate ferredoxin oxidoreductase alpha subunit